MGAAQTDKGTAPGKWSFITAAIIGAVLVGTSIWSLVRVFSDTSGETVDRAVPPLNEAVTINAVLPQEEIDRQHAQYPPPAPVVQSPAVTQPVVAPTKQHEDAVKLQQAKTKVNQMIVERMKQYIKDNPNLDTREIEDQIKRRESQ